MVVDSVVDNACDIALAALKAPGVTLLTEEQLEPLKSVVTWLVEHLVTK